MTARLLTQAGFADLSRRYKLPGRFGRDHDVARQQREEIAPIAAEAEQRLSAALAALPQTGPSTAQQ